MLSACLSIVRWKASILFSSVLVSVHSSALYKNIEAEKALKVCSFSLQLILLESYTSFIVFMLSIVKPFLLLISAFVSSLLPRSLQSLHFGSLFSITG